LFFAVSLLEQAAITTNTAIQRTRIR
jgi:hypothetical protein